MQDYVGCLTLTTQSDSTWGPKGPGDSGDRIPSPSHIVLSTRPVPEAQNPRRRPYLMGEWDYFDAGDLVAWSQGGDTLRIYALQYGLETTVTLAGTPDRLQGRAVTTTHMGYRQVAVVAGGIHACPAATA